METIEPAPTGTAPTETAPDPTAAEPIKSDSDEPAPALRVDAGVIVELDTHWDDRLAEFDLKIFRSDELIGESFESFLEPRLARLWRAYAAGLPDRPGPPPVAADLLAHLRPWPAESGVWLSVDHKLLAAWLQKPLFRLDKRHVLASNGAAQRLLNSEQGLSELSHLESFLVNRPSPLRLVPVPGLRYQGKALFTFKRPSLYNIEAFDFLARVVRAGLHDLSNPLSAMRMMAEVAAHGAILPNATSSLYDMTGHLDGAIDTIHSLRSLIHADSSASELDVRAEIELGASLLRSELARRDLELEIAVPSGSTTVAGKNAFRLLVTAGLLSTCGRATPGAQITLGWSETEELKELDCQFEGGQEPAFEDTHQSAELLESLATTCDGRLSVAPGERPAGDPDWRVELTAL